MRAPSVIGLRASSQPTCSAATYTVGGSRTLRFSECCTTSGPRCLRVSGAVAPSAASTLALSRLQWWETTPRLRRNCEAWARPAPLTADPSQKAPPCGGKSTRSTLPWTSVGRGKKPIIESRFLPACVRAAADSATIGSSSLIRKPSEAARSSGSGSLEARACSRRRRGSPHVRPPSPRVLQCPHSPDAPRC